MGSETKDRWDKTAIILRPLGGLMTAFVVAAIGFFGNDLLVERQKEEKRYLEKKQQEEMRIRLYTELITKREEAESALRKDMFKSIIESFLKPGSSTMDENILQLELLAYNFHESLNLEPLFAYFEKRINDPSQNGSAKAKEYLNRLHKIAREITRKQKATLKESGAVFNKSFDITETIRNKVQIEDSLTVKGITRFYTIFVRDADWKTKEINIRLRISTPADSTDDIDVEFWVGFFDFPMIDNTRLSHDQRCAIVLNHFEQDRAQFSIMCFPGSHASMKEKPYYGEIVKQLLPDVN